MISNTERKMIRVELTDATGKVAEAYTGRANAIAAHESAKAARATLIAEAASTGGIPASDIHKATAAVSEAASMMEISDAMLAAARDRESRARTAVEALNVEVRGELRRAALDRRIEAAGRVDEAIAALEEALADMDEAGADATRNGGGFMHRYYLHLSRQRMDSSHWNVYNLRGLADVERKTHGLA